MQAGIWSHWVIGVCILVLILTNPANTLKFEPEKSSNHSSGPDLVRPSAGDTRQLGRDHPNRVSNKTSANTGELETAPSITSVHHQVWTSSSSGSLEELSPEVISKLRQDVPFLAAYALRPRLVGGLPAGSTLLAPGATGASVRPATSGGLESEASSPRGTRQAVAVAQGLPKSLGAFNEFKVETSSLSKSEHRHKRRTSFKKRDPKGQASSSLVTGRKYLTKRKLSTSLPASKRRAKQSSGSAAAQRIQNKRGRAGRRGSSGGGRRRDSLQAVQDSPQATNSLDNNEDLEPQVETSGTKGGETKGGGSGRAGNKRPFYANGAPKGAPGGDGEEQSHKNENSNTTDRQPPEDRNTTVEANELDDEQSDEQLDDELQGEPKRVGDGDVDEEGDTVLVEPKSDGVDDDPPLPPVEDEEPEEEANKEADKGTETGERSGGDAVTSAQGDSRGRRTGRERPNSVRPSEEAPDGRGSQAAGGGGLGATMGGGGGFSPGVEFANDEPADEGEKRGGGTPPKGQGQFQGEDGDFGNRAPEGGRKAQPGLAHDNASDDDKDLDYRDDLDDVDRRGGGGAAQPKTTPAGDDGPSSLGGSGTKVPKSPDECDDKSGGDGSYSEHDEKYHDQHHQTGDWLRGSIPGEPDDDYPILAAVGSNRTSFKCSNQMHPGYYADVEARCQIFHICQADGRQDSFLCPNGTVFSQKTLVCVWWNGFDCEVCSGTKTSIMLRQQQKLLETLKLVTIFVLIVQQINTAIALELLTEDKSINDNRKLDAPKLYHLNELLYKSTSELDSPQAAALPQDDFRPLNNGGASMQPIRPQGIMNIAHADEDSSIDDILKAMRRRKTDASSTDRLGSEDEATIQRKSNVNDGSDLESKSPSRLRSRDNIPRRKRRASARQAPPRLKSRRVSRNSRRRKLRHGIKPKRRA